MAKILRDEIKNQSIYRIILIVLVLISAGIFILLLFIPQKSSVKEFTPTSQPLQETRTAVIVSPLPISIPTPQPSVVLSPKPSVRPSPNKASYIIAAYGDSMVDTMGENLDYLDKSLMARYPTTKFKFYNYGIGSQNVIEANKRFSQALSYQTRNYPSIDQINPDIIIISSFAYNPLSPYDKSAYLQALRDLISKAKSTGAQVYLLAEIAPLKTGFGKGVGGVNWDEEKVKSHVGYIFQNLDGATSLAAQIKIPLINAYEKSQIDGKYGNPAYVGTHDGIHPSIEGEIFMADIIADEIKLP